MNAGSVGKALVALGSRASGNPIGGFGSSLIGRIVAHQLIALTRDLQQAKRGGLCRPYIDYSLKEVVAPAAVEHAGRHATFLEIFVQSRTDTNLSDQVFR